MTITAGRARVLALHFALPFVALAGWVGAQPKSMTMPKDMSHLAGNSRDGTMWEDPTFKLLVIFDADQFP